MAHVWGQNSWVPSPLGWGWALRGTSLANSCSSSSANLSEANRVFKASPRAWHVKSSSVPTPPPIQIGGLVTQEVSAEHWPRAPLLGGGGTGWTASGWDGAFPKEPSPARPRCLCWVGRLKPSSFQPLPLQAPPQDGVVSRSSRLNSSPDSSENLSEIPLSYKGVPPASPVRLSLASSKLWCYPFYRGTNAQKGYPPTPGHTES